MDTAKAELIPAERTNRLAFGWVWCVNRRWNRLAVDALKALSTAVMRHGLTLGEIARWYATKNKLDVEVKVVRMEDYDPAAAPGFGWPAERLAWVNPSPNISCLNAARVFPGSVLLEGTTLSEGRGTTRSLELFGAPDIDIEALLKRACSLAPNWLQGCKLRRCCFEPTFHKHQGKLCQGVQIHSDSPGYRHDLFKPYRLFALLLKSLRLECPEYQIWRDFHYEYETTRCPIDLLSGSTFLRDWVDDGAACCDDFEQRLSGDEEKWRAERAAFLLY